MGAGSHRAVDGNPDVRFDEGESCFHTLSLSDHWWMVDLLDPFLVHTVRLTNRDKYQDRIENVAIHLYLSDPQLDASFPDVSADTLCAEVTTVFDGTKSFDCASPTYARYVLLKGKSGLFEPLHVCEVEVMVSSRRRESPQSSSPHEDSDAGCKSTTSNYFRALKNSTVENGVVVIEAITRTVLHCLQLCAGTRDLVCNAVYWMDTSKMCKLVSVNPYHLGQVLETPGTITYVEARKVCTGGEDGHWIYD